MIHRWVGVVLTCALTSSVSAAAQKYSFEMTQMRTGPGGRIGSAGKGQVVLKDGKLWSSGDVVALEDARIRLKFGGKVYDFNLSPKTLLCAHGKHVESREAFGHPKVATVLTDVESAQAVQLYDDLLMVPLSVGGASAPLMSCE